MYRIFMNITDEQFNELSEHLAMNGYACREDWETDGCLCVSEDEIYEVQTILDDRNINYCVVVC